MIDSFWSAAGLFVAGLAIFQTLLMVVLTWENRRFARNRLASAWRCRAPRPGGDFRAVPGLDVELEKNLDGLFSPGLPRLRGLLHSGGSRGPGLPGRQSCHGRASPKSSPG